MLVLRMLISNLETLHAFIIKVNNLHYIALLVNIWNGRRINLLIYKKVRFPVPSTQWTKLLDCLVKLV